MIPNNEEILNTTHKIQEKEFEMLRYFQFICEENNLTFYLCGGGLIGAVRHHGFIPWDDDLDVFMPRPDYEKLGRIWKQKADNSKYQYCRTTRDAIYHDGGASIRDVRTTFINKHSVNEDICHGLALEIMPIDGCPKSKIKRLCQLYNAFLFSLFNVQRLPDNKGKLIRIVSSIIYKLVPSGEMKYRIWSSAEKRMTKYSWEDCDEVTELIGSIKGMLLRHPKEDFDNVIYLDFNDEKVPVMRGYDRYLHLIWGDYMQLPPEEERVPKHDAEFIDLDRSYVEYKGKYYCKSK